MGRRFFVAALVAVLLLAGASVAAAIGQDPGLPQQWGLAKIAAPSAWGRSVGAGAPVAIVDTGVDLGHDDLKDQIMARVTCVDTGGDAGKCKVDGADIEGHGTHVAGIAAAASNNIGVAGVAPGARIVAVRVFGSTPDRVTGEYKAQSADIEAGIHWVIANIAAKGAINLSLGGNFVVTNIDGGASFSDAVEDAWRAGWVTVLASGNDNLVGIGSQNYGTLDALVVGATGPHDEIADYSSPTGNAKWAVVAPGGNSGGAECKPETCVLSTYKGNGYALAEGTSMATPHVTGAVALLMSGGMTNAQAVQRILSTANTAVKCGGNCVGRLDVNKAVPPEWKVASSSTATTVASGGGSGGGGGGGSGSASGATATTAAATSRSGGTTSGNGTPTKAGAGSPASTIVLAGPPATDQAGAEAETGPSLKSADGSIAFPVTVPSPTSHRGGRDDDGPPPALLLAAAGMAAAAATGAAFAVRRRQRRLSTVTTLP